MFFAIQGHVGFNLADEGFLWYGVQRILHGDVPIRDFMAYDPGRYYWSAWYAIISGDDGIMSVRTAAVLFQALGLFVALLLIVKSADRDGRFKTVFWALSALILILWMLPRHKVFDISLSIFLVGILSFMIANPTSRRCFITGICIGLVAVFGRNHGVYGVIGSIATLLWMLTGASFFEVFVKRFLPWGIGVAVGFLPIGLMAVMLPGFATAFWESILMLFEQRATNLAVPVPWPWTVDFQAQRTEYAIQAVFVGLFFLAVPVFALGSAAWIFFRSFRKAPPTNPVLVAAAFMALPYAHYAFSRADLAHLAQGIFPLLIGVLTLLITTKGRRSYFFASGLLLASLLATVSSQSGWPCRKVDECVDVEISGDFLKVTPGDAHNIGLIRNITAEHTAPDEVFLVTPLWPGAYALMEREAPVWEIYALFPKPATFERAEIARIAAANPGYVLILDVALDGQDALRFRNTHPLTYKYILDHYEPVELSPNPVLQLYTARNGSS